MVQNCEQSLQGAPAHSRRSCLSATAESSATSRSLLSREDQANEIDQLQQKHANALEKRYVRRSWWEKWARYVGYPLEGMRAPSPAGEPPGPVEEITELDTTESEGVPVCNAAWESLCCWYSVATDGQSADAVQLRFYCRRRSLRQFTPQLVTCRFRKDVTMDEVLSCMTKELSPSHGRTYLFDPVLRREFFAHDKRTLAELQIEQNTVFCLLFFNELGRKAGRVGLMNIGNTCYMNSSLQCLLHTPELMHYFLTEEYKHDIRKENPDGCGGRFVNAFYELIRHIWTSDHDQINPCHFWSVLAEYYGLFAEKDQHDTAELAETVLDGLMEDCNLADIPKPYYTEIKEDATKSDADMAAECWAYHKGRSSSFITDRFHGQYRILTTCPVCKFESRKFDSFTVLHLGLPPPTIRVIAFTLVEVCGNQLPRKYAVELLSSVTVEQLYHKAAEIIGYESETPWDELLFVLNRPKLTFLELQDSVVRISDYDRVLLYSYKGCDYGPSSGGRKTCFVHKKLVPVMHYTSYCYHPFTTRHEKQEFGHPLLVWVPHEVDEWTLTKKKRTFQGNLDIVEHSLRPFKKMHMAALQEEEQKDENLYQPQTQPEEVFCEGSDPGSSQARPKSSLSCPCSSRSDPGEIQDEAEYVVDPCEQHSVPDAPVGEEEERQHVEKAMEISESTAPQGYEMTTLRSNGAGPVDATPSGLEEEGEEDLLMGNLFENDPMDQVHVPQPISMSHTSFAASSSSSPVMHFGGATSPSEAYSLCESKSSPRADEARTFVIDWDSNAEQYYNLQTLDRPIVDASAQGLEEQRRKGVKSVTLYDCLTHEFSPHPCALDGDNLWKCGGCEGMVNGVKSMRLWKTPDILLIGLKRFDYCEARDRLIKLKQMVIFPLEGLDLSDFYGPLPENDAIYDLYGVCHHLGDGPKVGHYTSCVKSPGGKWHKFNDSWVSEIDERSVMTQDAYLLFYRKRNLPFPTEEDILNTLRAKERRAMEEQTVKLYESRIADVWVSDEEALSASHSHYGKDGMYSGHGENGSSSSNEMNNENDVTGLSSHGQGSSSSLCVNTLPHSEPLKSQQGSSSSAYYGPENRPEVFYCSQSGEVYAAWSTANDEDAIAKYNQQAQMQTGSSHEVEEGLLDDGELQWEADHESGSVQMNSRHYDAVMFTSMEHDNHNT